MSGFERETRRRVCALTFVKKVGASDISLLRRGGPDRDRTGDLTDANRTSTLRVDRMPLN